MKIIHILLLLLVITLSCKSQKNTNSGSIENDFYQEQKEFGTPIWNYLNTNSYTLNSLNELDFIKEIDSLKGIYTTQLNEYRGKLNENTFNDESLGIHAAFDKLILEYPQKHKYFTGKNIVLSEKNKSRLGEMLHYFNDLNSLSNKDFKAYVRSYISIESRKNIESHVYDTLDNQQLIADWDTIELLFKNQEVKDYWKQEYLYNHIDNMGIKNIDNLYTDFINSCKTIDYTIKIRDIYNSHKKARASHRIEIYKNVNGIELEMHLFIPDTVAYKGLRPTIVYFHGGSWSKGKPDWFFETATEYTKKGWVATAVEYRIKGKHGTYPFESVKDAKSALRWLRENAERFKINPNRIVATGNSAGGHLAIASALVKNWDEKSDDIAISPVPNIVIVNSAVYDLTADNARWIREYSENKNLVKEISPNSLVKETSTKFLLIHGEKDRNCTYSSAENFYNDMKLLGNAIEFHTVKNASHWIWFGRHYPEVSKITREYIDKLSLE